LPDHVNVFVDHPGGCYTCTHYNGRYNGEALLCDNPRFIHCPSLPKQGCAYWELKPGADDV